MNKEIVKQIDSFVDVRNSIKEKILPMLETGKDYYDIKGRQSLGKPGAEKLAAFFDLTASFTVDRESMELLDQKGMIAYVCNLIGKDGEARGQGRGADTLARNGNDANKTIKMAQKRAYVDAIIRATGLSDMFTQDLEDMNPEDITSTPTTKSGTVTYVTEANIKKCMDCGREHTGRYMRCIDCYKKRKDQERAMITEKDSMLF